MEWKRRFALTACSSYGRTVLRMVTGLLVFRAMYSSWDGEVFGFWAFLWSVFAFGILLDFGLGTTIQKTVASRVHQGDQDGINRVVCTVFWAFTAIGVIIFLSAVALRGMVFAAVDVPELHVESFTWSYYFFFAGIAIVFPMGVFEEVLNGVQRVDIANWIHIGSTLVNAVCVLYMLHANAPLEHVMLVAVGTLIGTGLTSILVALLFMKGLSVHPRFFDLSELGANLKFSFTTYLIIFSGVLLTKVDQAVIAGLLGLGAVTIYQAAFKVSEMLNMFATQTENLISPAAASLHSQGDKEGVIELLLKSSRFLFTVATPCYVLGAIYLNDLIALITGLETVSREAWLSGQFLLAAVFLAKTTSSCGRRVMVMCGMEKRLLQISVKQAVMNLALSVALARSFGVAGVAGATLITSATFGFFVFLPELRKFCGLSYRTYIAYHVRENITGMLVLAGILALVVLIPQTDSLDLLGLAWRGCVVAVPYLICNLRLLRSTWAI